MDRRSFLRSLIGGVAAAAAVRTFPFRVYSFPSQIFKPQLLNPQQNFNFLFDPTVQPLYDIYSVKNLTDTSHSLFIQDYWEEDDAA